MAQGWTFTLLGAPKNGAPQQLSLEGWQAPFGRPRKGVIVDLGTSIREQTTYFTGDNVPPVVHTFGVHRPDFEMHGRWMDFALGAKGAAHAMARDWVRFVEARLPVRARWGSLASYQIFIKGLPLKYESDAQIAWEMTGIVLVDESNPPPAPVVVQRNSPDKLAQDMLAEVQATVPPTFAPSLSNVLAILPEISDTLDTLVTDINEPFATIADVCTAIADFETAVTSDIAKLGAGITQAKSALLAFRQATDNLIAQLNATNAAAIANNPEGAIFSAIDVSTAIADKAASDAAIANLLALIADMQNDLDATSRGASQSTHTARLGDTWESIATDRLGSPDGARAIRSLNGIRFGDQPLAGKTYSIPTRG